MHLFVFPELGVDSVQQRGSPVVLFVHEGGPWGGRGVGVG